jgi:hypothetical protein
MRFQILAVVIAQYCLLNVKRPVINVPTFRTYLFWSEDANSRFFQKLGECMSLFDVTANPCTCASTRSDAFRLILKHCPRGDDEFEGVNGHALSEISGLGNQNSF